jgi:hypothetical protein
LKDVSLKNKGKPGILKTQDYWECEIFIGRNQSAVNVLGSGE